MEYRVKWEIDVEADSPEEAAAKARAIQQDPASIATVFDCIAHRGSVSLDYGRAVRVDLSPQ